MRERSFAAEPTSTIRFDRLDRRGVVRVFYGVTSRPSDSGFRALRGWSRERRAGVGFPTIKCEVESRRPGYWNSLGWIQWVTQEFRGDRATVRLVDRFPSLLDRDLPFAVMGYAPAFFDAPAFNSLPAVDFRATLFLTTVPILTRSEPIVPLVGVRWGYRIDVHGGTPDPHPLEPATPRDWREVRAELRKRHRRWTFAGVYRSPAPRRSRGGRPPGPSAPSRGGLMPRPELADPS